ncbi:MAG: hypothetical protein IT433_01290 [Phycisphaerales bacterium]|nr:hypothetical protein [Phycisphaerales bacterium]
METTTPGAGGGEGSAESARELELKQAFNAFKKRLKLTKLDHESRLGASRPMTSGKKTEGMGIVPPNQFPREIWQELAKQGKIKDMGGGFYSM